MNMLMKEQREMGRVTVEAKIENLRDLWEADSGQRSPSDVFRAVSIPDAIVDTGALTLSLPNSLIKKLGLEKMSTRRVMTTAGPREADRYSTVKLSIQGRDAIVDVMELPDGCPVVIGQIPLEYMDFVVDPVNQKLIGNPAHGGEWVNDLY